MVFRILFFYFLSLNALSQPKDLRSVEIYSHSLQLATEAVSLKEISDTSRFLLECSHPYFLNALSSFERQLISYKRVKRNLLRDYRILVALNYSDGTTGYMGVTSIPYVEYNGKMYKDEEYGFLKLINIYVRIKTIETFLIDHKLIDVNLEPKIDTRVCN